MVSFFDQFINFALVGMFIISLFSFIIFMQEDNSVDNKFIDNPVINGTYGTLRSDLGSYRDEAQSQKNLFERENPTVGFGSLILFSIISSGKVFNGMMVGTFNTIIKLPVVFLGLDPVIVSVLSTVLIITIIIGLWIIYKLGS